MADAGVTTPGKLRATAAAGRATVGGRRALLGPHRTFVLRLSRFRRRSRRSAGKARFGRAHHRVLHFVNRNPGMKVAELLDVLKITKQSLARVLKQLIDEVSVQKEGANDPASGSFMSALRAKRWRSSSPACRPPRYSGAGGTRPRGARERAPLSRRHDSTPTTAIACCA